MFALGVFVLLGVCIIPGVKSGANSLMCLKCPPVMDPTHCTSWHKCPHEEECSIEVRDLEGERYYLFDCKRSMDCVHPVVALMGKRGANNHIHDNHHEHEHVHLDHAKLMKTTLVCSECCTNSTGIPCNKNLCASYMAKATTAPTTAATAAPNPTTAPNPTAAPNPTGATQALATSLTDTAATTEQTGGSSASSGQPAVTAPNQVSAATTIKAAVPDPNCRDHEEDGISCAALDLFRLCSDSSVLSYVIAHEKCPKHCGFCTSTSTATSAPVTPPPKGVCADYEQDGFACSKLDLFSLCTDSSSLAYVISHEKCRKHCGFCQTG